MKLRKTWRELEEISIFDIIRGVLKENDLERLTLIDNDVFPMSLISPLDIYNPEYIYASPIYNHVFSKDFLVAAEILAFKPELPEEKSRLLTKRLIELYQGINDKYGKHQNFYTKDLLAGICNRIKYICLRLEPDGFFREDIKNGFIVGPLKPESPVFGQIVFSYEEGKLLNETKTTEDYFDEFDNVNGIVKLLEDRSIGSGEMALEGIGIFIKAIERMNDGKFNLINVYNPSFILNGMKVNFFKSETYKYYKYSFGPALMIGYNNDGSIDDGRDKIADKYDITLLS